MAESEAHLPSTVPPSTSQVMAQSCGRWLAVTVKVLPGATTSDCGCIANAAGVSWLCLHADRSRMASTPAASREILLLVFVHIQRLLARVNSVCDGILLALRQVEPGEGDGVLRVPV